MALPYPKRPFKKRGKYPKARNPSGKNTPKMVKLKLATRRKFYG